MVHDNLIPNDPVSTQDITSANKGVNPSVCSLKGKSMMQKPVPVKTEYVNIPKEAIWGVGMDITFIADIIYVSGLPSLLSISRWIQFTMVEYVQSRGTKSLHSAIQNKVTYYRNYSLSSLHFWLIPNSNALKVTCHLASTRAPLRPKSMPQKSK